MHSKRVPLRSLPAVLLLVVAGPLWGQARWTVEARPIVDIASESQGPNTLFNRIAHVEALPTGELLVVDGATRELRFFGTNGRFARKVGRNGSGPGEFRSVDGVAITDNHVHVFDASQVRLTRIDLSGADVTTTVVASPSDARVRIWTYSLGGLLGGRPVFVASGFRSRNNGPLRYTDSMTQFIYSVDGRTAKRIGEMAVMDAFYESPSKKGDLIFGRFSTSAVGAGRLFVTDGGRFSVRAYDSSGTLVKSFTREHPSTRATDADFEEYLDFRHQFVPNRNREELRKILSAIPRAEFKPFISRLLVDDESNLWVEHWKVHGNARPSIWSVFDASGRLLAEATFPRGFRPHTIRRGVVAGVQFDDDGAEGVRLLRVRR